MTILTKRLFPRLINKFDKDDKLLILIRPDPDSISSACALKFLLNKYKNLDEICISYEGTITRLENKALIKSLRMELIQFSHIMMSNYNKIAIVDSQPNHFKIDFNKKIVVVIDHHPVSLKFNQDVFTDNRPEYGACASILTEYIKISKLNIPIWLATALYYGIKTDTSNFERDTLVQDIRAFTFLYPKVNHNLLKKIEFSMYPRVLTKYLETALQNLKRLGNKWLTHLDKVNNPDTCVYIADFLIHFDRVTWCLVSGIYKEKLIIIFRTDGYRKDAGKFASRFFGKLGSAGGHRTAARAEIPLVNIKNKCKHIESFLFKHLKIAPDPSN